MCAFAQDWIRSRSAEFELAKGYLEKFGVAKIYRVVRVCQIWEGTSDIQRMMVACSF